MGAQDDAVESPQGAVGRERLHLEDVKGRCTHPSARQGVDQGAFVDQWSTSGVDDPGSTSHHPQRIRVDHVPIVLGQRAVERQDVHLRQEFRKPREPHTQSSSRGSVRLVDVGSEHMHAHGEGARRHRPADCPEPDDPHRAAGEGDSLDLRPLA